MKRRTEPRVLAEQDRLRQLLLTTIGGQGGEWTTGRVKSLIADRNFTHVYRASIRKLLERLCTEGVLVSHNAPGRRYYTRAKDGAQ